MLFDGSRIAEASMGRSWMDCAEGNFVETGLEQQYLQMHSQPVDSLCPRLGKYLAVFM